MSNKFNYSKQFNKNEKTAPENVTKPTNQQDVEQVTEPEGNKEVKPEVQPEVQPEVKFGVVSGCIKLNVRKGASKETDPVNVISKGTKVIITEVVNEEWFKITTANGKINGYCMAEFISVN